MKLAVFSLLIGWAAAFAPAPAAKISTALNLDATKEIGAQAPLGFYDPMLYCGNDPTDVVDADFNRLRYTELKHGRCAMLGVVGYLTTSAGVRFPGAEDIPGGFAALNAMPGNVWLQMLSTVVAMEAANGGFSLDGKDNSGKAEFAGDFRNGKLDFGWGKKSDAWQTKMRARELNNGRAAQMGILGLMVHDFMGNTGDILPYGQ